MAIVYGFPNAGAAGTAYSVTLNTGAFDHWTYSYDGSTSTGPNLTTADMLSVPVNPVTVGGDLSTLFNLQWDSAALAVNRGAYPYCVAKIQAVIYSYATSTTSSNTIGTYQLRLAGSLTGSTPVFDGSNPNYTSTFTSSFGNLYAVPFNSGPIILGVTIPPATSISNVRLGAQMYVACSSGTSGLTGWPQIRTDIQGIWLEFTDSAPPAQIIDAIW